MWDVAVVGAGPAGATAALGALRSCPGARVLLLDRARFPRDKVCGDGIAPHVLDVLADLGVAGLLQDRIPVDTLELALGPDHVTRPMARCAWVVPRADFDARLVAVATGAGAELRLHRVRTVQVTDGAVVIDAGTPQEVRARVVVAADGASSVVARALGRRHRGRTALALRGYARTQPHRQGRQVIRFGQARQPSYAWSFDCGDGWSNVGYGELVEGAHSAGTGPARRVRQLVERIGESQAGSARADANGAGSRSHQPLSQRLALARLEVLLPGATSGIEGWRGHLLPLSTVRWQHPAGRVLLAGDAAGLVNPLTGEGIYYAVATGALAGRTAVTRPDQGAGATYRKQVRALLGRHLRTTAAMSRLAAVPGVLPAGMGAATADQGVFDDLVEIGLGGGVATGRMLRGLLVAAARD